MKESTPTADHTVVRNAASDSVSNPTWLSTYGYTPTRNRTLAYTVRGRFDSGRYWISTWESIRVRSHTSVPSAGNTSGRRPSSISTSAHIKASSPVPFSGGGHSRSHVKLKTIFPKNKSKFQTCLTIIFQLLILIRLIAKAFLTMFYWGKTLSKISKSCA